MFTTRITPRVSETDALGHINNTVPPVWFEAARMDFFRILGPIDDFAEWRGIVVNLTIDYHDEILYPDEVTIRTWIERVGRSSIRLYEELEQRGRVCCTGRATYVNVDPATRRATPLTDEVRAALLQHLREGTAQGEEHD